MRLADNVIYTDSNGKFAATITAVYENGVFDLVVFNYSRTHLREGLPVGVSVTSLFTVSRSSLSHKESDPFWYKARKKDNGLSLLRGDQVTTGMVINGRCASSATPWSEMKAELEERGWIVTEMRDE